MRGVSELGQHPGTEYRAQTGVAEVDLSVRVLAKRLLYLFLECQDLGSHFTDDGHQCLCCAAIGSLDSCTGLQLFALQGRSDLVRPSRAGEGTSTSRLHGQTGGSPTHGNCKNAYPVAQCCQNSGISIHRGCTFTTNREGIPIWGSPPVGRNIVLDASTRRRYPAWEARGIALAVLLVMGTAEDAVTDENAIPDGATTHSGPT